MNQKRKDALPLINERIRFDKLQLIVADGQNRGIVSRSEALAEAKASGLDLVIIAESGGDDVPVAKIMDYGKLQYEKKKQSGDAKKKQQIIQIKEIKLRPKIADGDYTTKLNQGIRFLREGKHLKVTLMFRGREIGMKRELGAVLFDRVEKTLEAADLDGKSLVKKDDTRPGGNSWSRIFSLKK
jgi:translation initiation factor IF-3